MAIKSTQGVDMTNGNLFLKMISFSIPLIITNILQLLYNAADMIVVGQFAGPQALSAVGSNGALVNLIVNCFMGLSVGAGVAVSRNFGAKNEEGISKTLHTAIATALISSVFVGFIGIAFARPLLTLIQTPADVIDGAVLYIRIFFLGMPFNLVYNFGAAMLRAVGDTKRPLKYLSFAGIINVLLNLFFVIVLKMSVAGVAIATITAQAISTFFIIRCFLRGETVLKLDIKKIKIEKEELKGIVKIGLPAGISGSLFSLSNVTIQSAVNTFGSTVVAGNVAGANIGGFIFTSMSCVSQAALTSAAQNIGAKQYKRMRSGILNASCIIMLIGIFLGGFLFIFAPQLVSLYNSSPEVVEIGVLRLRVMSAFYSLCGLMDVGSGQLRGMGISLAPTLVSFVGICVFRLFWVGVVFPQYNSLLIIYYSFPISWTLTSFAQLTLYYFAQKRFPKENFTQEEVLNT